MFAQTQTPRPVPTQVWAPKPIATPVYTPPQRPWVKLADVRARHQGELIGATCWSTMDG